MRKLIEFFKTLFKSKKQKIIEEFCNDVLVSCINSFDSKKFTAKETKLYSDYLIKQSEKYSRIAQSLFSQEEKIRASTCKEGDATKDLHDIAIKWLSTHNWTKNSKYKDIFVKNRPNTKNLLGSTKSIFSSTSFVKYYNIYFASWYYKRNWEKLVTEWLESV